MNWFVIILVLIAGIATSIQASVNGLLGKKTGIIEAALISFSVGTIFLFLIFLTTKKGDLAQAYNVPKWQLTGGILGACYIITMVIAVPKIGLAAAISTLIVGQLVSGTIIDHWALFGVNKIPFSLNRLLALVFLSLAIYLFYKK